MIAWKFEKDRLNVKCSNTCHDSFSHLCHAVLVLSASHCPSVPLILRFYGCQFLPTYGPQSCYRIHHLVLIALPIHHISEPVTYIHTYVPTHISIFQFSFRSVASYSFVVVAWMFLS